MKNKRPVNKIKYSSFILLIAILIFYVRLSFGFQYTEFEAVISRFEAKLANDVKEDAKGSISAAVVIGNKIVWEKGFGWADVQNTIPADERTVYRTGSISKSFTAVLMVQLSSRNIIKLDDPVERYFPEIQELADTLGVTAPITFRQLASHTAGLIREPRLRNAASGPIEIWEEKILESIPRTYFQNFPGEKYSYSNIGFGILGLAVSRAAGKSFMKLVSEYIFKPLRMEDSFFIIPEEKEDRIAAGYQVRKDGTIDAEFPALEHRGRGYKVPNGGIYSTAGDLARFVSAMTGTSAAQILSAKQREEMMTIQTPESDKKGYGLGFSITINDDTIKMVGHGGSVAGYNAHMVFNPESKTGVILLRNYNRGKTNLGRTAQELLRELVMLWRK